MAKKPDPAMVFEGKEIYHRGHLFNLTKEHLASHAAAWGVNMAVGKETSREDLINKIMSAYFESNVFQLRDENEKVSGAAEDKLAEGERWLYDITIQQVAGEPQVQFFGVQGKSYNLPKGVKIEGVPQELMEAIQSAVLTDTDSVTNQLGETSLQETKIPRAPVIIHSKRKTTLPFR